MARDVRPPEERSPRAPREPLTPVEDDPWAGDLAEDEIELRDRHGRLYALRPLHRGRYDYLGFGAMWWLLFWLVIIGLIVWWAWAWSY